MPRVPRQLERQIVQDLEAAGVRLPENVFFSTGRELDPSEYATFRAKVVEGYLSDPSVAGRAKRRRKAERYAEEALREYRRQLDAERQRGAVRGGRQSAQTRSKRRQERLDQAAGALNALRAGNDVKRHTLADIEREAEFPSGALRRARILRTDVQRRADELRNSDG